MGKLNIISGQKFNRLTIIEEVEPTFNYLGKMERRFNFKCECGNIKEIRLHDVKQGVTKSCGCLNMENKKNKIKHSHTINKIATSEYDAWSNMKQRCNNLNNCSFKYYGGRGIKVCDRWLRSFKNFIDDMGRKPGPEYSLDRINNDGNYEPINCKWSTLSEQNKNKRR